MNTQLKHFAVMVIGIGLLLCIYVEVDACTRIFWNTNPDLMIVGRNEDYVTASHPTFVATPRGVKRCGAPRTSPSGPNRSAGRSSTATSLPMPTTVFRMTA